VKYDFNVLEKRAKEFIDAGQYREAMKIYFFMSDGDSSLDGGYLGERLGECYEALGELAAAKYWYGRAVEENPHVCLKSAKAREKLEPIVIGEFQTLLQDAAFKGR
jgi:tetratricopeptide (TPR) repeat protein